LQLHRQFVVNSCYARVRVRVCVQEWW